MVTMQGLRSPQRLKWLYKAVIYTGFTLLIISFVFFYGWSHDDAGMANPEFGRIRSESVLPWKRWTPIRKELMLEGEQRAIAMKQQALPQQFQQFMQSQRMSLASLVTPEDVTREAANAVLLSRAVRDTSLFVPDSEIIDEIKKQPGVTNEMLTSFALQSGYKSQRDYIAAQSRMLEEARLRTLVSGVAHASLFELWQEYAISREQLDVQVAGYPAEAYAQQVAVTEAELQQYLDDHKDQFEIPTQRRYAYVAYTKAAAEQGVTLTEDALRAYYEQHQTDYMQQPGRTALEIMAPRVEDRSTTEIVAALNAVRDRAAGQSDWTTLTLELEKAHPSLTFYPNTSPRLEPESGARPAEYMTALNGLELNAVSEPVVTEGAVYLIKLIEKQDLAAQPFEQVRSRVESDYRAEKATEAYETVYTRFQAEHGKHENIRSLAQALGIEDKLTTMVAQTETMLPEVGNLGEHRDYLRGLQVNELSDAMRTSQVIATVQVVDEVPAHVPTLAGARAEVEQAFRLEKAVELARAAAEQAERLIASGADFKSALSDAPKVPFDATGITRLQPISGLGAPLIGFNQQTLKVKQGSYGLSPYGQDQNAPLGYAVWQVTAIKPAAQADFTRDRAEFERDYVALQRETVVREWLRDLRSDAHFQLTELD